MYRKELFNMTCLKNLENIFECFKCLYTITDQISNVGNPISKNKMALHLVFDLMKGEYDNITTLTKQSDWLLVSINHAPSFSTHPTKQKVYMPLVVISQQPP